MSPPRMDWLPPSLRKVAEMLIAAGVLVIIGIAFWTAIEAKARAAAETAVERIESKIDRLGCMTEAHIRNAPPADFVKCANQK